MGYLLIGFEMVGFSVVVVFFGFGLLFFVGSDLLLVVLFSYLVSLFILFGLVMMMFNGLFDLFI